VRIDLHTHSTVSDGTESPAEVVRAAKASGLDVLALTDHDTTEGWDEAAAAARELDITLVRGLEISTKYAGQGVHLLGYLPDPTCQPLVDALQKILDGRNSRVPAVLDRLRALGIDIDLADIHAVAGDAAAIGRPHIADALMAKGVVKSRDEAFRRFLGPRGPAYVDRYAAPLEEMIGLVAQAGGVSVVAHPWGRHLHSALDVAGMTQLRDLGLSGIEVDHNDHSPETRERLRTLARELDLVVTGSSDYHGLGKEDHPLGCNLTSVADYEELLSRAAAAAAASGRVTPGVLVP
jgi:predicted metal-dependent phosphoesterase TrpH